MRLAVLGTGHVGLVTCVAMARIGHEVAGTDSDPEKIAGLQDGRAPFFEPGLDDCLAEEMVSGRLRFASTSRDVVPGAEAVFICVGTPSTAAGEANLAAVERSAIDVAHASDDGTVVIEKSTVPAGTAERVKVTLARERPELEFEVVSNPEFLREGQALRDALEPQRILVGAGSDRALEVMRRLYEPLTRRGIRLIETEILSAELAKLACNAFLALKISYANALARICELAGGDVEAVVDVMGSDSRIGREFLNVGLGYGGYCFPKDLAAFDRLASKLGYAFPLLAEVSRINEQALDATLEKVRDALWNLEGKRVALLGLAYKPGTDDVRFSPALSLARKLALLGAEVVGYDPQAAEGAKEEVPELELAADAYLAAESAHCVILCTDWQEFRSLDLARLRSAMTYPVVVDPRNQLDPNVMLEAGFAYYPTGRPPIVLAPQEG
jgi:UDPglucose 6-dehydrogenase